MESTLFTELTVSEQASVSGGGVNATGNTFNLNFTNQKLFTINAVKFGSASDPNNSNGIFLSNSTNQTGSSNTTYTE